MKNYTQYEFEDLVPNITKKFKDKPGLSDSYDSSVAQTLIQLLADTTDHLMYKLERRSQENYASMARLSSSVRAAVSSVGYRPRRKVSSTGILTLKLVNSDGDTITAQGNINILRGTPVYYNDVHFIVDDDYTIPSGTSEIDIKIKQGKLITQTFNFEEEPYKSTNYIEFSDVVEKEEYSLDVVGDNFVFKDVFEDVDGLRIRSVSFASSDMPVYDVKYVRNGMRVVFGDGIFGMKPDGNIKVSWVESLGSGIKIVKRGLEFTFESPVLYDDVQVIPSNEYLYTLTNKTPIRGGVDEEDIDEMRNNLTAFVRSNDRGVTNFDYSFWAMRSGIGDIVDIKAYGEHETNRLIFTMNNVYMTYATPDRLPLNREQEMALRAYFNSIKVNTTHLVFRPVDPLYLGLDIDFRRHPDLPISDAQLYRVLVDRVYDYFEIKKGSIGKEFQHSEFIEYMQNLVMEFNDIVYPMTDFVKVKVTGMKDFSLPQSIYDGVITLDPNYTVVANDVWTITIDNNPISIVATSMDSVSTLVDKMQAAIFKETYLMLARPAYNKIRLTHPSDSGIFGVTVGTGQIGLFTTFDQLIKIPRPSNYIKRSINQILPGSVDIVDFDGNVMMVDDGEGKLISDDHPSVTIDYTSSQFSYPSIPENQYYIRLQQNRFQNFQVSHESLIDVMPFRSELDNPEKKFFSSLNILR